MPKYFSTKDNFTAQRKINSFDFPYENPYLVSFDAVQLFTNIPVNDTIDHIISLVNFDRFPINDNTLRTLLQLACTNVPFLFNSRNYLQKEGMSMGSSLAPLMAEFSLNIIESKMQMPDFYIRYVDDILAVFRSRTEALTFLDQLNAVNSSLQFTIEEPINDSINFLDMNIFIKNGKFETNWITKETNTLLYTHSNSYSPDSYKNNAIKALYNRSQKLSSLPADRDYNKNKVRNIFIQNGYHPDRINKVFERCDNPKTKIESSEKTEIFWKLPYVSTLLSRIKRNIRHINSALENSILRIALNTYKTQNMISNKDKIPFNELSSVVYKYTCEHCSQCYVGETRRHIFTRINEHVKGRPASEISLHVHIPNKDNFKILIRTPYTKIAESLYIKSFLHSQYLMNNRSQSQPLFLY